MYHWTFNFYINMYTYTYTIYVYISVQFTLSCPTLCDLMDYGMPGLPVHRQLLEFTQTHVHGVGDAIQPSHPLLSPAPPALNLSKHQGLFQWVSSELVGQSIGVSASFFFFWSFRFNISPSNEHPGLISFRWTGWISLQSKGLSRAFSNTTVQKHQFLGAQLSL